MVGGVKQLLLICAVVALVGCGKKEQAKATPDASANKLFVEAVKLIGSADEQTGEAAIKDYEQGLANIQTIIDDYSESDLAVKLISGETLFTGKSLKEIKERVKELKRIAAESVVVTSPERSVEERFLAGELTEADLEKVTVLNLDLNQLTEIPKGLEKLTQLTELSLYDNQLTSVKGLEKLTQLTWLSLERNQLTDVKGLEKLTQLTYLGLENNQLTNVKGLENLTQLKGLYLQNNQLTEIPKGLEKLTQLTYLDLDDNPDLTKAQIAELKKALPKCSIFSNPTK